MADTETVTHIVGESHGSAATGSDWQPFREAGAQSTNRGDAVGMVAMRDDATRGARDG
jgi:hypothetical protein